MFGMQVKVLVDRRSVEEARSAISRAAQQEARSALLGIAREGVEMLRRLELGRGHEFFATLWTHTPIMETANGGLMIEIYSRGEEMTFYSRSGPDRQPDPRYPIKGKDLLGIMEAGAKAHVITPRNPGGHMVFEAPESGEPTSVFGGTFNYGGGIAESSFASTGPFRTIGPTYVSHPGVVGNEFISTTRRMIEMGIEADGQKIAERIVARLR